MKSTAIISDSFTKCNRINVLRFNNYKESSQRKLCLRKTRSYLTFKINRWDN